MLRTEVEAYLRATTAIEGWLFPIDAETAIVAAQTKWVDLDPLGAARAHLGSMTLRQKLRTVF